MGPFYTVGYYTQDGGLCTGCHDLDDIMDDAKELLSEYLNDEMSDRKFIVALDDLKREYATPISNVDNTTDEYGLMCDKCNEYVIEPSCPKCYSYADDVEEREDFEDARMCVNCYENAVEDRDENVL